MAQTKVSLIKDNVIVVGHLHTNHGITTGHIGEGSNLYFTDARVMTSLGSVSTHIIPDTNIAYDLGSPTNRFRDLYLSSNTIHLGTDTKITVNNDGEVEFKDSSDAPKRLKVRELDFVDDQGRNKRFKIDATSGRLATFDAVGTLTADKLDLSAMSTTDLAEGSNLYYTDARVGTYLTTNSYATQVYVNQKISDLIASAPSTLDTLNELAAALGDDPNFATTVSNQIGGKLSSSDSRIANWDTAYGWGNHASVGYLTTVGWNDVTGKPSTFTPSSHTHSASDITSGTLSGARLEWYDNDGFNGTYPIVWTSSNGLYRSTWLQIRGSDDSLLTKNIIANGDVYATGGNSGQWNTAYGWGNHASAGYQSASSAITTSNIGSQSVSHANTSGDTDRLVRTDNRIISPSELGSGRMSFGFTSFNNNNTAPWADFIHLRGYTDNSGGNDNLLVFSKSSPAMRIYSQTYGSSTAYSNYVDVITSGNIGSQSVSYAANAGTLDGIDSSNFFRTDGTYPNTDMNTTVEGYWHVASGSANLPVNYYGHRWDYDHIQNGQWVFQMYSPTSGDVDLWFRQKRDHSATAWQKVITSANIGSYAAPIGGSWNGANMPGSRWAGFSANGGEIVFQADNPNNGQMSIMVDGNFYAGENNGFWSLYSNNSYNSKAGMYADGNGYLILDSPYRVKIKAGSNSQMNINHDQIWTDSGNLHFQYSGSGNIDMNQGGGYTFSRTSLRAPIFYDSNDTNYHVDPNSSTNLYNLTLSGAKHTYLYINPGNGYESMVRFNGGSGSTWYVGSRTSSQLIGSTDAYHVYSQTTGQTVGGYDSSGNHYAVGSSRAPIFYDLNNTAYYCDPASNSNFNEAGFAGTVNFTKSTYPAFVYSYGNTSNVSAQGLQVYSSGGNGAIMAFHRGGYYAVNMGLDSDNVLRIGGWSAPTNIWQLNMSGDNTISNSVRSPIFYDSNNTAYFVDANNRSYLNKITTTGINDTDVWEGYITVDGDANTYYPVGWYGGSQSQVCEIEIHRNYSDPAPSTWYTSTHRGGLVFRCSANFGGWGGVAYDIQVQDFRESYTTMMGWMGHFANSRAFGFRLRGGGGRYYVRIKGRSVGPTVTYGTWDPGNNGTGLGASTVVDTANIVRRRFASGSRLYSYDNLVLDHGSDHQTKSGILQSNSSLRAPVFYDSNDTNYYLEANGTSRFYNLNMPYLGSGSWNLKVNDGGGENWRAIHIHGGVNDHIGIGYHTGSRSIFGVDGVSIHYDESDSFRLHTNGWDTEFEVKGGGEAWLKGGLRASIFYDRNNTAYYCNPATQSNLVAVTLSGTTNTGYINCYHSGTYGYAMNMEFAGSSSSGLAIKNNRGSTGDGIAFIYGNAPQPPRGNISISSTGVSYNSVSDYRAKENVTPLTGAIDRVSLLKPSRFNFIGDEETVDGFLAHEVQEVVPQAVNGEKDAVDHEGNELYQSMDASKMVPLLTAALQEAIAKIEDLESRLQAIENQ